MRSKSLISLLLTAIVLTLSVALAAPTDYDINHPEALTADQLYGQSCLVMDADTGVVLFEKDADARRYPASITKIVTCILAIELAQENGMLGKEVTIPIGSYVNSEESRMELTEGDRMTFEDLLYGMMIKSGNDAANAAALLIAGSTGEFVKLMNSFVESLGISPTSTHFTNVTGMHDVNHFTTARDLATIMAYCLQNDIFRQMIACTEYTVYSACWPDGKSFKANYDLLDSTKALYYSPCIGGKTGYTKAAGRSFIGAAEKDDITLIAVSLNPPDANSDPKDYFEAFTDNIRLFKYGFLQYENRLSKSDKIEQSSPSDIVSPSYTQIEDEMMNKHFYVGEYFAIDDIPVGRYVLSSVEVYKTGSNYIKWSILEYTDQNEWICVSDAMLFGAGEKTTFRLKERQKLKIEFGEFEVIGYSVD